MITAEQVKASALAAGITEVLHHDCAGCGEWTLYIIHKGELYFDPSCGCGWAPFPEPRQWQETADWINMQSNEDHRSEIMKRWGIGQQGLDELAG